jgi:hypothetical protein
VLLPPATPPALVDSLWELLAGEPEAHEVLHAVTSASSGSLAQIPWFGIVDFRDSLRVFLRGDIELTAQLAAGAVELNGRDVTTWTERRLSDPKWCKVAVPGDAAGATELPLGEGVVLLQRLTVVCEPAAADDATAEAVPAGGVAAVRVPDQGVPVEAVHAEHDASAETVIGLSEDELEYTDAGITVLPEHTAAEAERVDPERVDPERVDPERVEPEGPEADSPGAVPANELTGSYDHLWDKTVVRRIEDAAVRDEPEDQPANEPGAGAANEPAAGTHAPAPGTDEAGEGEVAAGPLIPAQLQGGLIDSVPWNTGGDKPARPSGPPSFVPATAHAASGDTPDRGSPAALPPVLDGDHDGETIMKSVLAGLGTAPQVQAPIGGSDPATGPMVLARVCGQGHANPPTHSQCAGCGLALASDAVQVRRPRLGRVRVSSGELIDLDQSLVIGRQPSVSRVQGGGMPRLVQVASPSGDISRSHVEVRLEGWHVMLCDLKATNGTVLVREGQPPRRLAQNEMAILLDGDIAELGDDVSLRFEEIL